MIAWESLIIALYGSVLGAALGLLVGQSFVRALRDEGIADVAVPWGTLIVVLGLDCAMGLLAAVVPAWRGARLDVLAPVAEA
jgi:putative ABC transport system permease protein